MQEVTGNIKPGMGVGPAVALWNPKYGHNVSGVLRACSAFSFKQMWFTGDRVLAEWSLKGRLPREERMKGYGDVDVFHGDYFFDAFGPEVTPIAVEVLENAEPLATFVWPEFPLLVFGPEDGSLSKTALRLCHRRIILPSNHCLNLATAVTFTLGTRRIWRQLNGLEPILPSYSTIQEDRGWHDGDEEFS